jgi:hypothetical protein
MNKIFEFENEKKENKNFTIRFSNDIFNNNPNNKQNLQTKFSSDKFRGELDEIGKAQQIF